MRQQIQCNQIWMIFLPSPKAFRYSSYFLSWLAYISRKNTIG